MLVHTVAECMRLAWSGPMKASPRVCAYLLFGASARRHLRQHFEHSQAKAKRDLIKSKMVPTRPSHTAAHGTGRARNRTAKDLQLRMAALLRLAEHLMLESAHRAAVYPRCPVRC